MKQFLPLVALAVVAFSSCTSAYKTGQTPDDVYFSPTRPQEEYVRVEKKEDKYYRGSDDYYEDRFLRMRVMDRYRWSALDDYYFYNTYSYTPFGNYYSYNNPWSMNWAWNAYYNPYCSGPYYYYPGTVIIKNPRYYTPPSRAVAFNPASYNISRTSTGNRISGRSYNIGGYNNSNSNRPNNNSLGESIRKVFTGSNSNNNGNYNSGNNSTPSRSYNPSSGNSSSTGSRSSGGSSGGGGGVSRPPR